MSGKRFGVVGRPRLLFVINEAYFLLSHRRRMAYAAAEAGFEVHVAAPTHHAWAPVDFNVDALRSEGWVFHPILLWRRGTNPLHELATFLSILRLLLRVRPEVVHFITIKPNLYGGLAARIAGVPAVVYAVTGLGHLFSGSGAILAVIRAVVVRILAMSFRHPNSRVLFQNNGDRRHLVAAGIVEDARAEVVGGAGVDLSVFALTPESGEIPVVVLAARLIWEKGVREFVEAARLLCNDGVRARFVLIGGSHASNPRAVPPAMIEGWVKEGIVEWLGYRQDMPALLAESHVVCLPSVYGEGVPKIVLEAAACGRPVVATRLPGCIEAIEDGETGLLVPPGDVPALARALRTLIQDPLLRRRMGAAARARAELSFDENDVALQAVALYRTLLGFGTQQDMGTGKSRVA